MTSTELVLPNGTVLPVRDRRAVAAEHRDPRGATRRNVYASPALPQIDEWNAEQAFRLGVAMNVIAYRCVQLRARAAASVPWVSGRRLGDATSIVENAPLTRLLGPPPGGPAPKLSARKLLRWTFAQKIVTGRRAWEIETDRAGRPVAFWPLAAAQLKAYPSAGGTDWFRAFDYGLGADPVHYTPDQVFFGWEPSGNDFRQAESELQSARFDLSLINLCDRHSLGFLRNNAVPAAIITTTAFPSDEKRRSFINAWSAEFGGPDNAGRVAINEVGDDGDGPVGDSIDVKVLGLSAKDARLVEQRKELAAEVAIALGTPWSKLDASGRTFANAEAEDQDWWENTILPDLLDLQDDINMQLAPRLGSEVGWFDLRGVRALQRRVTPITQPVGAPALMQSLAMQINEARAEYGLEPLDDGDRMLSAEELALIQSAASLVAAERTPEPTPAPAPSGQPPAADEVDLNSDTPAGDRAAPTETRIVDLDEAEQRRARIWHTADATVRSLEARWTRAFARLFARQADSTVARLTGKRGRQAFTRAAGDPAQPIDVEELFSSGFWVTETLQVAVDLVEAVVSASGTALAVRFGIDFDLAAPWVAEFIDARANQLAGNVTTTTYEAIQAQLVEGVQAGESIDDLAARIRTLFTQTYAGRAETVARTEVIGAYNGASMLGAAQLPADVVAGAEWIATRDGRTREAHASADGQLAAIGAAFDIGGAAMAYPGDPAGGAGNVVNCRCTVAFLTPDEWAEASSRGAARVEHRTAKALLMAVRAGDTEFDLLGFRRALQEVAA